MASKQTTIFVGGIHGVGKSKMCAELAAKFNLNFKSAGQLIREANSDSGKELRVQNVTNNQDVLVSALERLPIDPRPLLLDGHFCLLNKDNEIEEIPTSTFQALNPRALLVITNDPNVVHERLLSRDGSSPGVSVLSALQQKEIAKANSIGALLQVQTFTCSGTEGLSEIESVVSKLTNFAAT